MASGAWVDSAQELPVSRRGLTRKASKTLLGSAAATTPRRASRVPSEALRFADESRWQQSWTWSSGAALGAGDTASVSQQQDAMMRPIIAQ
jgi:hypothetical protein